MEKRKPQSKERAMLINDMPEELILEIFSYLDIRSRKNTRLVCKNWNRILHSNCIRSKEVTNLKNDENIINFVGSISPYSRHPNVKLSLRMPSPCNSKFWVASKSFWQSHGEEVRSLNIELHDGIFWVLQEIAVLCPYLEHIEIETRYELEFPTADQLFLSKIRFPKLQSIELKAVYSVIVSILGVALMSAPMLEKIGLEIDEDCEDWQAVAFPPLFKRASKHVPQIQEIAITNCNVHDIVFRFPEIFGFKLKKFVFDHCREMGIWLSTLKHISEHCPNLNCLVIDYFQSDNLRCFDIPLRNLSSLTTISFNNSNISDDILGYFAFLNHLSYVDLSDCNELTQRGIFEMFGKKLRSNMLELRLACLDFITDDVISVIAPNIPNLKVLDLTDSKITSLSLHTIMNYNPTLRCLNLSQCKQLWPPQPSSSTFVMNNLIHFDVSGTQVSQEFVEGMQLPRLEVLIWKYFRYESSKKYSGLKHQYSSCTYNHIHYKLYRCVHLRCCNSQLPVS